MPINVAIEVKGIKEVQRALRATGAAAFYAEPYRDAAIAIGQLGEQIAARSAPRRTGRLEARISHAVQRGPLPRWIRVKSYATRRSRKYRRGYNYGRLLNYASDIRSRNRRRGDARLNSHRGWFTTPLRRLGTKIGPILSPTAREVERRWGQAT